MKRFIILLIMLLMSSLIIAYAAAPKIALPVEQVDIGQIQQTQGLDRSLTVQNTGDTDLIISSINVDCPCTSFQLKNGDAYQNLAQNQSITIAPNSQIELKLIFDSNKTKYIGKFTKYVVISSNDPEHPVVQVKMIGEIIKKDEVAK